MKNASIFTMASACLLAVSPVQAGLNLVQDPGFEGGESGLITVGSTPGVVTATSSPWFNPAYNPPFISQDNDFINSSHPHSGSFNAVLQPIAGESPVLLQQMSLTAGIGYTISFWISTPIGGGDLDVSLNGTDAGTTVVSSNSVYTQYNLTATPITANGVLEFLWTGAAPGSILDLDDVSVTVPEPTTMVAGALMLLPFAASTLRLRKKVSQ